MFVWNRGGSVKRYEIVVQRDWPALNEQIRTLFPGEDITAHSNGKSVVLSGNVSRKEVVDKAIAVAAGYVDKKEDVVTLLAAQPGPAAQQVLLRVRFAEVSRSAMTELGASFFTSPTGVQEHPRPHRDAAGAGPTYTDLAWTKASSDSARDVTSAEGKINFSDFLNLFFFNQKYDLGAVIRAMQQRGLFQSLAEPNLVAESGKEASFLAGGEFPVPIAQGSGANLAISVHVQGIRRPPELHADRQRRPRPPQGQARGQHARLRQRGGAERLPHSGALDAPHRDGDRAAQRPDVRDRRSAEQPDAVHDAEDSGHRRHPDPRAICSAARRRRRTRPSWS